MDLWFVYIFRIGLFLIFYNLCYQTYKFIKKPYDIVQCKVNNPYGGPDKYIDVVKPRNKIAYSIEVILTIFLIIGLFAGSVIVEDNIKSSNIHIPTIFETKDTKISHSISDAIEPSNPKVRSYALSAIKSYHSGKYNINQICDIYDKLYRDWVYVSDPNGVDYNAPASESVKLLRGDCDDYAILMASLIESIGGSARVIVAHNSNSGHAYAEVYLSDNEYVVESMIKSISRRYGYTFIHYKSGEHNGKTEYWLNLDWTASHPGGEFYKNTGNVLAIYPNGHHERVNFKP